MTRQEFERVKRKLADASSEADRYRGLARRLRQREKSRMEMWDGSFDMPGDVPARMPTTTHDSSRKTGSSMIHNGRLIDLSAPGPATRYMRLSLSANGAGLRSPEDAMRWAAARIGREAFEVLGAKAMSQIDVRAVWVSPADWTTEVIVVATHQARTLWLASGCELSTSLRDIVGDPVVPHGACSWSGDKVSRHYRTSVSLMNRERAKSSETTVTLPLLALMLGVASILGFVLIGPWCGAGLVAGSLMVLTTWLAPSPSEGAFSLLRTIGSRRERITVLTFVGTAVAQLLHGPMTLLPIAFVALMVVMYHHSLSEEHEVRARDFQKKSVDKLKDGAGQNPVIDTLLSICSVLPADDQAKVRIAADRCSLLAQFDPNDPIVADARRSVSALDDVLKAHRNASRYASDADAIPLAHKVMQAMASAGEDVERARQALLASATDALETQTRYLASRASTPSSLESIR